MGTAQLTRPYGISAGEDSLALKRRPSLILKAAEKFGFTGVDTAPVYGSAEYEIGEAATKLALHTKLDPSLAMVESVENSLRRLKRGQLDIVYFHHRLENQEVDRIDSTVRPFLDSEVVKNFGISVYDLSELRPLESSVSITVVQAPFSVLDRRFSEDVFAEFVKRGGQVFIRSVFLQGLLLPRSRPLSPSLNSLDSFLGNFWRICANWDVDPIDGAIQFVFRKLPFAGLVIGARSVDELHRILESKSAKLPEEYFIALDEMNLPPWHTVDPRRW